jgi:hypothetical protein
MRKLFVPFVTCALVIGFHANASPMNICTAPSPQVDSFGWVQFYNSCSMTVNVFFKRKAELGSNLLTLPPGHYGSTGLSRNEIAIWQGLQYAACENPEVAFELDGKTYWKSLGISFICK